MFSKGWSSGGISSEIVNFSINSQTPWLEEEDRTHGDSDDLVSSDRLRDVWVPPSSRNSYFVVEVSPVLGEVEAAFFWDGTSFAQGETGAEAQLIVGESDWSDSTEKCDGGEVDGETGDDCLQGKASLNDAGINGEVWASPWSETLIEGIEE